jgi:hypothetical protein
LDDPSLIDSTIISAGLGEDASFEIEFSNMFNSKVIMIDPTPRAILHFNGLIKRIGLINILPYDDIGGNQPLESYNLLDISSSKLKLIDKALWNKTSETVKFYLPKNH